MKNNMRKKNTFQVLTLHYVRTHSMDTGDNKNLTQQTMLKMESPKKNDDDKLV